MTVDSTSAPAARILLMDVARLAGVSRTTASFVLTGRTDKGISAGAADRVRQAARDLGYRPSLLARSLRTNTSHTIGLLSDGLSGELFAGELIRGALAGRLVARQDDLRRGNGRRPTCRGATGQQHARSRRRRLRVRLPVVAPGSAVDSPCGAAGRTRQLHGPAERHARGDPGRTCGRPLGDCGFDRAVIGTASSWCVEPDRAQPRASGCAESATSCASAAPGAGRPC